MSSKSFYVWLTAANTDFADRLVMTLIKRGYTVSPLGRSFILSYVDKPAVIAALGLVRLPKNKDEEEKYTCSGIHDEVMNCLKLTGGKIYSIVVSESTACTWNVGNMSLEEMEREETLKKQVN